MSQADLPPNASHPYASPSAAPQAVPVAAGSGGGDSTGGIIPYKNPAALFAYYLGLFSLFPLLGLPLGIAAFILGIKGLRDRKRKPEIKGSVHAWIGIVFGFGTSVVWGLAVLGIVIAMIAG